MGVDSELLLVSTLALEVELAVLTLDCCEDAVPDVTLDESLDELLPPPQADTLSIKQVTKTYSLFFVDFKIYLLRYFSECNGAQEMHHFLSKGYF